MAFNQEEFMKFQRLFLLVLCLSGFVSVAHADAEAAFLLSGGEVEIDKNGIGGTDTAFKLGSGFKVTPSSGIEIYWAKYGEPEKSVNFPGIGNRDTSTEISSLAFQYVHFFPIGGSVNLLARFGMALWKSEVSIAGSGKFEDDGVDLAAGAGAEVFIAEDWALRAEWEYSELHNFETTFASVGLAYYFE